jgi:hypothetical protein
VSLSPWPVLVFSGALAANVNARYQLPVEGFLRRACHEPQLISMASGTPNLTVVRPDNAAQAAPRAPERPPSASD